MDFSEHGRRRTRDSIVPMINIVFLLLIFFLLTVAVRPASPFAVSPPESAASALAEAEATLFVAADGRLAFADARGEAVFEAIREAGLERPLPVRADRDLPGPALGRVLSRLGAEGIAEVRLVVGPR
jgi:biopolymer transport protein ExbD